MSKSKGARAAERSLGSRLLESLTDIRDALASGEPIEDRLTVRKVKSKLTPHEYGPEDIKKVRVKLKASQGVLAEFLGVTPLTVSAWELGRRKASRTICRYLDDVQEFPELWARRIKEVTK